MHTQENTQMDTQTAKEAEAINEVRNQYFRDWRAKNKEKVQAINARYWAKKTREAELNKTNTAPAWA